MRCSNKELRDPFTQARTEIVEFDVGNGTGERGKETPDYHVDQTCFSKSREKDRGCGYEVENTCREKYGLDGFFGFQAKAFSRHQLEVIRGGMIEPWNRGRKADCEETVKDEGHRNKNQRHSCNGRLWLGLGDQEEEDGETDLAGMFEEHTDTSIVGDPIRSVNKREKKSAHEPEPFTKAAIRDEERDGNRKE